jgi:putative serine protease PepD
MRTPATSTVAVVMAVVALSPVAGCTTSVGSATQPTSSTSGTAAAVTPSGSASAPPGGTTSTPAAGTMPLPSEVERLQATIEQAIKQVLPSVVEIHTSQDMGSGVIFDEQGNIVTNAHVVGDNKTFQVNLAGQARPVSAQLVGVYQPDDLAVIRLSAPGTLRPATFADPGDTHVGDMVLAMGNPLGLSSTVTNGIVSAVGRTIAEPAESNNPGATIPNAIQTSASINPGNSGGALANLFGKVIGIPTLAALNPEIGGQAPGIGFAISADTVRRIAPQLITNGKVTNSGRAALGISAVTVVTISGKPVGVGVMSVVNGGPAARAGIQPGDIITQVAGQDTPTMQSLAAILAAQQVGAAVPVQFERGGQRQTVTVTLGSL